MGEPITTKSVRLGRDVYIAPTSYLAGDVVLGDECTVMHHVTIRGDIAPIRIGRRVNVQDGVVIHTPHGVPLEIGDEVGIGHRAVVHCRRVAEQTLIGIGAIVLDDCAPASRCILAAAAGPAPGSVAPDGARGTGRPGGIVRDLTERDFETIRHVVESYVRLGRRHASGEFPNIHDR